MNTKLEYLAPRVETLPLVPGQTVLQASGEGMGQKEEEW